MRLNNPKPYVREIRSGRMTAEMMGQQHNIQCWRERQRQLMHQALHHYNDYPAAIRVMGNAREACVEDLVRVRPEKVSEDGYLQTCRPCISFWQTWDERRDTLELAGWRIRRSRRGVWIPRLFTTREQVDYYAETLEVCNPVAVPYFVE